MPALCTTCGAFATANYLEVAPRCADCQGPVRFYTDPAFQATPEAEGAAGEVFASHMDGVDVRLPDTAYRYSACTAFSLHFCMEGLWD